MVTSASCQILLHHSLAMPLTSLNMEPDLPAFLPEVPLLKQAKCPVGHGKKKTRLCLLAEFKGEPKTHKKMENGKLGTLPQKKPKKGKLAPLVPPRAPSPARSRPRHVTSMSPPAWGRAGAVQLRQVQVHRGAHRASEGPADSMGSMVRRSGF